MVKHKDYDEKDWNGKISLKKRKYTLLLLRVYFPHLNNKKMRKKKKNKNKEINK